MKIPASTNGVSTIAIPKHGCGLDQMNWQENVKLLRDVFAYADVKIVVYTLEENGVHALSTENDAEFHANHEIERHGEELSLENHDLETGFTKDSKSCQPTCDEQIPVLRDKDHNNRPIDHYLQYQPKELINYVKKFNFEYSDITDEEMILLNDMLVGARDVYSHCKLNISSLHRELCGIVSSLQTYEHYIIGSPFSIYLFCDHKPTIHLWGRKRQLSHRFFRY